jgi:hypothetical protein
MAPRRLPDAAAALVLAVALPGCGGLLVRPQSGGLAPVDEIDTAAYVAACEQGCARAADCLGDPATAAFACVADCEARATRVGSATCAVALEREAQCFAELDCAALGVYFGAGTTDVACATEEREAAAACGPEALY